MKVALTIILLTVCSGLCFGQNDAIEKDFEKNKSKYTREKFSEGEDASSGTDYLVYKNGTKIVKFRVIWSSSAGPIPSVEDYYFADGKLVLFTKSTLQKKFLKSAVKGKVVPLKTEEKLWLKDDKLTKWLEKGKTIEPTDTRWKEREREVLEAAKGELESFKLEQESTQVSTKTVNNLTVTPNPSNSEVNPAQEKRTRVYKGLTVTLVSIERLTARESSDGFVYFENPGGGPPLSANPGAIFVKAQLGVIGAIGDIRRENWEFDLLLQPPQEKETCYIVRSKVYVEPNPPKDAPVKLTVTFWIVDTFLFLKGHEPPKGCSIKGLKLGEALFSL